MLDLADLRFFQAIAAAPSLAAAARALGVSAPAVSQRLAQIELRLGLRLVERGAGAPRLTAEGALLAARGAEILADAAALSEALAERRAEVSGPLRLIAPFGFGRLHVAPLLGAFALAHPGVTPELTLTEDPRGAARRDGWDLLIHVGRLPDLDRAQRRLARNRRLLVASPDYLARRGLPESPAALARHACGALREDAADVTLWQFTAPDGTEARVRVRPAFASNDGEVIRDWALAGLGIVERSEWSVAGDLAAGRLCPVLPGWQLPDADVVALLNPRAVRAARITACLEHLARHLPDRLKPAPPAQG